MIVMINIAMIVMINIAMIVMINIANCNDDDHHSQLPIPPWHHSDLKHALSHHRHNHHQYDYDYHYMMMIIITIKIMMIIITASQAPNVVIMI